MTPKMAILEQSKTSLQFVPCVLQDGRQGERIIYKKWTNILISLSNMYSIYTFTHTYSMYRHECIFVIIIALDFKRITYMGFPEAFKSLMS